jgi:hypothetical protein
LGKFIAFFDLRTVLSLLFAINENYNKIISDIIFVKYVVDVDVDDDGDDVILINLFIPKSLKSSIISFQ